MLLSNKLLCVASVGLRGEVPERNPCPGSWTRQSIGARELMNKLFHVLRDQ